MKPHPDSATPPQQDPPPHSEALQALLDIAKDVDIENGWPARKAALLQALEEGYSITGACRLVHISRTNVYLHANEDPAFQLDLRRAYHIGGGDWGEDALRKGVREGNMQAIGMFLRLRGRQVDPVRIVERSLSPRPRQQDGLQGQAEVIRVLSMEELEALAAPAEAQEKAQDGS